MGTLGVSVLIFSSKLKFFSLIDVFIEVLGKDISFLLFAFSVYNEVWFSFER